METELYARIEQALACHRSHIWDANGERHEIAIRRIKKTAAWFRMMRHNEAEARNRANERLTRQGF